MIWIRQVNDKVGVYSPRPRSQSDHSAEEESQARGRSCVQDGDFIERFWETEGLSAVKKAFNEKERKRKREKESATHGHSAVQLHSQLRHDGHFAPARPQLKHMRNELDQGEPRAKPRHGWCGDSVAKETSNIDVTDVDGYGDGDLQEGYCGLQYFGGTEGAKVSGSRMEQAECFNSSFHLLTIEPRKLRTGYISKVFKNVKHAAARTLSPCLSVESMHSSCCPLSPSSPEKRFTNDNVGNHDENICCPFETSSDCIPTDFSPPDSPSGCPLRISEKPISAPQKYESSGVTYADADHLSPRQYGLYEMANVDRLQASSQRVANQFRNLGICNEFPDSCVRTESRAVTEALKDAHQETLQKARNPGTATRLDNMKASILCHGFYPRLVEAYIRRRRVGASPEMKQRLRDFQAQVRDWKPPNMTDFNANEAVKKFHSMIIAYEKDLERPFQKSMSFCEGLEKELESMESTTRAASANRSAPQEHIRSIYDHANTITRKPVRR